jgi:hypothetical protein
LVTWTKYDPGVSQTVDGGDDVTEEPRSGFWVGWVIFAAFLMWIAGAFQIIAGITALSDPESLAATADRLPAFGFTVWGWVHIVMGTVVIFAGIGVRAGATWARAIGIVLAALSAISNLTYAPAQPEASILLAAMDVLVIYALAVHAREPT